MNKTVLLCRVSSKEQEIEGYSLQAQEKLLKEYVNQKGFEIAKNFTISETASGHKQRQIFNEMIAYVQKNKIKQIVCEKVDRLTRNLKDAVDVNDWINKDRERQVHFVKEGVILNTESKSNEKFIWNIKVSVAQYYIDNLSEEVKKGQKEKLAQGWLPTRPPLGYKTVGENGHRIHVIDEAMKPFALKIFDLYSTGDWSLEKIANYLYEQGLRSKTGHKINKSTIHAYLTDPFYIGFNRWNGQLTPGKQETFISKEKFSKVDCILRGRGGPKYGKHFFLFKGLVHCTECGGVISWETHKDMTYGHCNHYRSCSQKTWKKEPEAIDQLIKEGFGDIAIENQRLTDWLRRALKESHREEIDFNNSNIEQLNSRREVLQNRLDKIYDDKLDGVIDQQTYQRKFKEFTEEKQQILDQLQKQSESKDKYQKIGSNLFEIAVRATEIFQKSKDSESKRSLINLIFDDLLFDEGRINYDYKYEFALLREIAQLIKSSKIPKTAQIDKKIFELQKNDFQQEKILAHAGNRSSWLPGSDSNGRPYP